MLLRRYVNRTYPVNKERYCRQDRMCYTIPMRMICCLHRGKSPSIKNGIPQIKKTYSAVTVRDTVRVQRGTVTQGNIGTKPNLL